MISIALIIVSAGLLIYGKMPLYGGKIIRGIKVRCAGAFIFAISVSTLFLFPKISLILSILVFAGVAASYFFIDGDATTKNEAKEMLFTSKRDEIEAYSSATMGLIIAVLIMVAFGGDAWLLLKLIKG